MMSKASVLAAGENPEGLTALIFHAGWRHTSPLVWVIKVSVAALENVLIRLTSEDALQRAKTCCTISRIHTPRNTADSVDR